MELFLHPLDNLYEAILGFFLILSSIGVITLKKPVHASLAFLMTLLLLAMTYIELTAEFIGIMQVLVYAGAILIIFMFVVILFQDAHEKISQYKPRANQALLFAACALFIGAILLLMKSLITLKIEDSTATTHQLAGSVQEIGKALYLEFFFPFEAVVFLFLIGIVGAFYTGKKQWSE